MAEILRIDHTRDCGSIFTKYGYISPARKADEAIVWHAIPWLEQNVGPWGCGITEYRDYQLDGATKAIPKGVSVSALIGKAPREAAKVLHTFSRIEHQESRDGSWDHFQVDFLVDKQPTIAEIIVVQDDMLALQLRLFLYGQNN
jgi:hypothetical protein